MIHEARPSESHPARERHRTETDWCALVDRHAARVRSAVAVALRAFGERPDPDRVDDLVQEVWCRLLERDRHRRAGPRGVHEGETASYLRRVAATVVADVLRADGAAKRRPRQLVPLAGDAEGRRDEPADPRTCPLRSLLARDQLRRFLETCGELAGRRTRRERRRLVRLAFVAGLSSSDIAARLGRGWTAAGVDAVLFRLRRRLSARGERVPAPGARGGRP